MWEITKAFKFEAAHYLPAVPEGHQCGRMHGHSYVVEVSAASDSLVEEGWVVDFAQISELVKPLVKTLDHNTLNNVDGLENPTSERLAEWFWRSLIDKLECLTSVVVRETEASRCEYRGPKATKVEA